jgi:hypothetical protein
VKLAGTVLTMLRLENGRQLRGKLHIVSTTGGLMHLDDALDEGIKVEVMFHVGSCTVRNKARLLFPMWATKGCMQPFEFIDVPEDSKKALQAELDGMINKGAARVTSPEQSTEEVSAECALEEEAADEQEAVTQALVPMEFAPSQIISANFAIPPELSVPSDLD